MTAAQGGRLLTARHRLVLVLAANSGVTDALGVLALGGAFTSVMTGNMVLAGLGAATGDAELALLAVAAILCFSLGCAFGARLAGTAQEGDPVWPRPICRALVVQLVLTTGFAVGWWVTQGHPGDLVGLMFLMVNALGLGLQSSAVQRLGQSGLSTTYLTGTLTTLVVRLATGHRIGAVWASLQILLALVAGAALGGALMRYLPLAAPIPQLCCLAAAVAGGRLLSRQPTGAPLLRRDPAEPSEVPGKLGP
jgi:uncharacterized membrane protein YoaK (UPF0700 family)